MRQFFVRVKDAFLRGLRDAWASHKPAVLIVGAAAGICLLYGAIAPALGVLLVLSLLLTVLGWEA